MQVQHPSCGLNIHLYDHNSIDHYIFPRDQNRQRPFNNPDASFTSFAWWQWSFRFAYGIHICPSITRAFIEFIVIVDHAVMPRRRQLNLQTTVIAYTQQKLPILPRFNPFLWAL